MARKILTDDGQLEEVDMDEVKSSNKELGQPDLDDEEGRSNSEPDGEDNPKKQKEPKNAKTRELEQKKLEVFTKFLQNL